MCRHFAALAPRRLNILRIDDMPLAFFFNDPATTHTYTLSLHDALPISHVVHIGRLHFHRFSSTPLECNDERDRKSTRLNSSHVAISYAVFCLKKKKFDMLRAV